MSLKKVIQSVPLLHRTLVQGRFQAENLRFLLEKSRRARKYGKVAVGPSREVVEKLRRDGYAIVKQAVDKSWLLNIKAELEACLDSGQNLKRVTRDSARKPGDRDVSAAYLSPEEIGRGQAYFRDHSNYVSVDEPLVHTPSVLRTAFHEPLTRIASEYFGCPAALGGINLRKSFVNTLSEFDTLFFHCDGNSPDFLKYFFYLNDVDAQGGPFCFIRGSHRRKFPGWNGKTRWTYEEMVERYPKEDILHLTADVGDLIIANTTGFHRGTKVVSRDRSMLTLDWVVYPEYWGNGDVFHIRKDVLAGFTSEQRRLADFLKPVESTVGMESALKGGY